MRLKRGSGLDGLAAMPVATEGFPRHLRPLLDIPRARLKATLSALSQGWIEDPSNANPAFERNAATEFVASDNPLSLSPARIALAAKSLARARTAIEEAVAKALAASATLSPLGSALLDPALFARPPEEVRLRALARLLMTVGGEPYTPRLERLERLLSAIDTGTLNHGRTLAGCRIRPEGGKIRLLREAAAIAPETRIGEEDILWDRRFRLRLSPALASGKTLIGPLTPERWREIREEASHPLPALLRATLPVLWDDKGIVAAPFSGYCRKGVTMPQAVFAPVRPLT
jgi:tRNA(Ile)-lysidine synthase